jgi:hypothetical protein
LSVFAVAVLYLPTPHTVQSESSSWANVEVVASTRYVPAGHDVQFAVAIAAAYFPAPHVTQRLDDICAAAEIALSVKNVPTGHDVQSPASS